MAFTPSSLADGPDDTSFQEEDFIRDPDQARDRLPQPFRAIDKILQNLIGAVLENIVSRETERVKHATRVRAPQYQCGVQVEAGDGAGCMASSPDGQLIVLGMSSGLIVIQADTQCVLATWRDVHMEVVDLQCDLLEDGKYIISTIDDMGIARLFAYYEETLLQMAVLNEQEGDKRLIATRCEASSQGLFVGVCFESPGSQESWLEFHRCPKETWLKEIETTAKSVKKEASIQQSTNSTPRTQQQADGTTDSADASLLAVQADDSDRQQPESRPETPGSHRGDATPPPEKTSYKFTGLTLMLRVRPPSAPAGVSWSSPYQLSRTIDSSGEFVGTGANHQVSLQHLEQRTAMFEGRHQELLQYENSDSPSSELLQGNFHFLTAGRLLPHGLEQSTLAGQPSSVCIWWGEQPQVTMYSLHKQAKELEHKPDVVWPLSSGVVASAISPCTSLLAFGLQNSNLVIWDKYMGLPRRVVRLPGKGRILSLSFLDPSLSEQGDAEAAYKRHSQVSLLAFCSAGDVYTVPCGPGNDDPPQLVPMSIEHPSEQPTMVKALTGIPELIMTCHQNGQVFLQDLTQQGHQLCEVTLPTSHQLTSPWQPVIAVGNKGQMLYIRATQEVVEEDEKISMPVFVFQLRSFPALDVYREKQRVDMPFMVHSTAPERVDALLRKRLSEQSERKDRMQLRWHQLKDELGHLQRLRSSREREGHKGSLDCLSVPRTPPTSNQHLINKFWS